MVSDREKSFLKSAVLNKFISQDQAKRLLEELQDLAATGSFKGAGDLAIEKGFMTRKQVQALHGAQERARIQKQNVEYGQAALALGLITQTQLEECVNLGAAQPKGSRPQPVGEVMMSKNYITMEQHERIMSEIEEPTPTLRDPKPTQRLGVCTACDNPITVKHLKQTCDVCGSPYHQECWVTRGAKCVKGCRPGLAAGSGSGAVSARTSSMETWWPIIIKGAMVAGVALIVVVIVMFARRGKKSAEDYFKMAKELDDVKAEEGVWNAFSYDKAQKAMDEVGGKIGGLAETQKFEKQAEYYLKAIELKPDYLDAHLELGRCYVKMRRPKDALESFKKVLELNPNHAYGHFYVGCIMETDQDYKRAEESYLKAISLDSTIPNLHKSIALMYHEHMPSRRAEAVKYYREALKANATDAESYSRFGALLADMGDLEESCKILEQGTVQCPNATDLMGTLVRTYFKQAKYAQAVDVCKKVLPLKDCPLEVRKVLGLSLYRLGRIDEAQFELQDALKCMPGDIEVCEAMGLLFLGKDRCDEAYPLLDSVGSTAAAAAETRIRAAMACADISIRRGDTISAAYQIEKIRSLRPDDAECFFMLARAYVDNEQMVQAEDALAMCKRLGPADKRLPALTAACLRLRGDLTGALSACEEAEAAGASPDVTLEMGLIYEAMFSYGDAIESYTKCLKTAVEPQACACLAHLYDMTGAGKEAVEYYSRYLKLVNYGLIAQRAKDYIQYSKLGLATGTGTGNWEDPLPARAAKAMFSPATSFEHAAEMMAIGMTGISHLSATIWDCPEIMSSAQVALANLIGVFDYRARSGNVPIEGPALEQALQAYLNSCRDAAEAEIQCLRKAAAKLDAADSRGPELQTILQKYDTQSKRTPGALDQIRTATSTWISMLEIVIAVSPKGADFKAKTSAVVADWKAQDALCENVLQRICSDFYASARLLAILTASVSATNATVCSKAADLVQRLEQTDSTAQDIFQQLQNGMSCALDTLGLMHDRKTLSDRR